MQIITLISDLGTKDNSVSVWKASLINSLNNIQIVDISHQVDSYNIFEAFYIFYNSYKNFPKNTIHLIGINAVYYKDNKILLACKDNHYFICTDNGLLSLISENNHFDFIKQIKLEELDKFLLKNSFVEIAKQLINNPDYINNLENAENIKNLVFPKPIYKKDLEILYASIIYVDNFGNSITNVKKEVFYNYFSKGNFEINANFRFINKVYEYYDELTENITENKLLKQGEIIALFNEYDFLEISIYKSNRKITGGASSILGLKIGKEIKITKKV